MILKRIGKLFTSKLLGPGPRLMTNEFTGPRSHKVEKHCYVITQDALLAGKLLNPILTFLVYKNVFENHITLLLRNNSR